MHQRIEVAIAGLVVGLVACTKYDYDPNQPRNWVNFYALPGDQFPAMIDALSIQTTEERVQFDSTQKFLADGGGQTILTTIFNCETGAYTIIKRTWLNVDGQVIQQETSPKPGNIYPSIAQPYAQLCKQVGVEPTFLSHLDRVNP